jgi:hypothetical protein
MDTIKCPRCTSESRGRPYLYQTNGYARCPSCGAGIKYVSTFFKHNITATSYYIPDGCYISQKTDRILCSEKSYKAPSFVSYLFKSLVRHPNPDSQRKRKGTLKDQLTEL